MNMKHAAASILASLVLGTLLTHPIADADTAPTTPVRQIDWKTLLPAAERSGFRTAPPPAAHDYLGENSSIAAMQSGSYEVNPELDGKVVKVPGFVVPLQNNARGEVVEFFLVPYFGACIHVPPPPPNQIIYVKMRDGAGLRSIEDAQWITGRIHARSKSSSLGAAAYTLDGEKMEAYEY
jgi:hypothetical protein